MGLKEKFNSLVTTLKSTENKKITPEIILSDINVFKGILQKNHVHEAYVTPVLRFDQKDKNKKTFRFGVDISAVINTSPTTLQLNYMKGDLSKVLSEEFKLVALPITVAGILEAQHILGIKLLTGTGGIFETMNPEERKKLLKTLIVNCYRELSKKTQCR